MSGPEELPFVVVVWSVNAALREERIPYSRLADAINRARELASDERYRSTQVLDLNSMCFAQFNLLWNVPPEYA
jgi:hypothetical protein